ncbi:MAG TPA: hypothetical protein VFB31_03500 [Pseudolabrys sp.]|nr:hypothetical protein [Pseudolabrys sp.]
MVGIIRFFGVLSIIVAVPLIIVAFGTIFLLPTLLPLGASALLGGALLLAFARVVELLEELNTKLSPIQAIAMALEQKYSHDAVTRSQSDPTFDPKNPIVDPFSSLPVGSRTERHFRRRMAYLPDGTIFGETDDGPRAFQTFEDWRRAIGK